MSRAARPSGTSVGTTRELPEEAYAAALSGLAGMTLARLRALLDGGAPPSVAWAVVSGAAPIPGRVRFFLGDAAQRAEFAAQARRVAVEQVWERCLAAQCWVAVRGDATYPAVLAHDPAAPPVVFGRGDPAALAGRRAAVVGTRNATAAGRQIARELGYELAASGVAVVSGLARGIDGAAHRGALGAVTSASPTGSVGRPVAVVANGLDVIYPREHRDLYDQIAMHGLLLSEVPPGTSPEAYRFPLRNRIVAALAEVLVVVESRHRGGSMITVEEANRRNVPVMVVPGAVSNPAAAGVNTLLRDGALIVLEPTDVLTVLAMHHAAPPRRAAGRRARGPAEHADVYAACQGGPRTLEQLVLDGSASLIDTAVAVRRLVADGWLTDRDGWYEAVGAP